MIYTNCFFYLGPDHVHDQSHVQRITKVDLDHDPDLDEDQDRAIEDQDHAIEDEEEDRLQAGPDHETDLVMGPGPAKRKFQKIQFEVENILQIQMMINQSKHEKTGS